ncbi:GFA family protein [Biformimicrobium ophioploci]|uniref:GFA family protein n=1 Tax=Biformimicrobium ophioploci TaxID=3036711 RepID=A0ABQ6M202_9GAMM|nr:GFA family protein [Microbulbifer sp. NKW57]GMG88374.1 GFA family protein [Microbulbifer sp. NKW57]
MSEKERGGCLCGGFSYQFDRSHVVSAMHCHCKDCQKTTGSGKATIVLVPTAALETEGELKTYTVTGSEGAHVSRGFCPNCGSQVLSHVEELPTMRMVKAGSLDDTSWLKVESSCWGSAASPWSPADTSGHVFECNPELQ